MVVELLHNAQLRAIGVLLLMICPLHDLSPWVILRHSPSVVPPNPTPLASSEFSYVYTRWSCEHRDGCGGASR